MNPLAELHAAEARLTDARQSLGVGDAAERELAVASAESDVASARFRCGAVFAELLMYAADADGVKDFVARQLDRLDVADAYARGVCEDLGRCVEALAWKVQKVAQDNWELAGAVLDLRRRTEALEYEHERQTAALHPGQPGEVRGGQQRSAAG